MPHPTTAMAYPTDSTPAAPPARRWARQFVAFAAVGIVATGIQYAVLLLAVRGLHYSPVVGSSAGYVISAGCNYLLNYHFTFRSENSHSAAVVRFAIITSAGFILNGAIVYAMIHWLQIMYLVAQVVATAAVMMWNFLGSALWTFSRPEH